jgi:FkbM family methyltransferase
VSFLSRAAWKLLRLQGYSLTDAWDSWQLVLADRTGDGHYGHLRKLHRYLLKKELITAIEIAGADLVVDVGAHVGRFARDLRRGGYGGHVLSCEPNPAAFAVLDAAASRDPRWHVLKTAIGPADAGGTATLRVSRDASFASTLHASDHGVRIFGGLMEVERTVEVPLAPLESVLDDLGSRLGQDFTRVFLKSDTQGVDREVLGSLGRWRPKVWGLLVELPVVPIYEGLGGLASHHQWFESQGFKLTAAHPVSWDEGGRLVEMDALYLDPAHPVASGTLRRSSREETADRS